MLLQISEFIYRGKAYLQRAQCFMHTTHVCCRENLSQLASRACVTCEKQHSEVIH